jgi:hypothetical protein
VTVLTSAELDMLGTEPKARPQSKVMMNSGGISIAVTLLYIAGTAECELRSSFQNRAVAGIPTFIEGGPKTRPVAEARYGPYIGTFPIAPDGHPVKGLLTMDSDNTFAGRGAADAPRAEGFSIDSLTRQMQEVLRTGQLETINRLSAENSLLYHLIAAYRKQWSLIIDLIEQAQEALAALQRALGHCFSEEIAAERNWLAFGGPDDEGWM